jgi:hypothetical protein
MLLPLILSMVIAPKASMSTLGEMLLAKVKQGTISIDDLYRIDQFLKTGSMTYGVYAMPNGKTVDDADLGSDEKRYEHLISPISDSRAAWLQKISKSFRRVDLPKTASDSSFQGGDCGLYCVRNVAFRAISVEGMNAPSSPLGPGLDLFTVPDIKAMPPGELTRLIGTSGLSYAEGGIRLNAIIRPINGDFLKLINSPFAQEDKLSDLVGLKRDWMKPHPYSSKYTVPYGSLTIEKGTQTIIHRSTGIAILKTGSVQHPPSRAIERTFSQEEGDMHDCVRIGEPWEFKPGAWRVALGFIKGKATALGETPNSPKRKLDTLYLEFDTKELAQEAFDYLENEVRP